MKNHPATEAAIKNFAKQFAIPVKLARQAFAEGSDNYTKAYEWLLAYLKQIHGIA